MVGSIRCHFSGGFDDDLVLHVYRRVLMLGGEIRVLVGSTWYDGSCTVLYVVIVHVDDASKTG